MSQPALSVRPPAVAGTFYPGTQRELAQSLAQMLGAAAGAAPERAVPKAIVAPHAGYVYSGPVAASVYKLLAPARERLKRVVLLGPTHRVAVRGLALPGVGAFETPLGIVEIDRGAVESLRGLPQVVESPQAHALEHSLEVHVPFLQTMLGAFKLVPLAVGRATQQEVADVLERLWGGPETLIVVSSDLSHYLPYADAQAVDRATANAILALATDISHEQACGATPVTGLAVAARRRGLRPELLDLRNSGDTAGDRDRVVGYGSFAYYEVSRMDPIVLTSNSGYVVLRSGAGTLPREAGQILLPLARAAIAGELGIAHPARDDLPWLREQGACFITVTEQGRLRGCIGTLRPHRALAEDVRGNAIAAAFRDPRFKPLAATEFATVSLEISVLSPLQALAFADERDALRQLRPGVDGIVLEYGHHSSTFLPQVWESFREPAEFLAHLKQKAGLPPDLWDGGMKLMRYTVQKWREEQEGSDT